MGTYSMKEKKDKIKIMFSKEILKQCNWSGTLEKKRLKGDKLVELIKGNSGVLMVPS